MSKRTRDNSITVTAWLKPHLHQFATYMSGGRPEVDIVTTDTIGSMLLACLTPKADKCYRETESFFHGRLPIVGLQDVEWSRHHGYHLVQYARFEAMVEHLFANMLLAHVDACVRHGVGQNQAIRQFLASYGVHDPAIDVDSIKKQVIRRRKKLRAENDGARRPRSFVGHAVPITGRGTPAV
jgi:hypothetical protein